MLRVAGGNPRLPALSDNPDCGKRQKDKLFKLLLFRKNVSVCFNVDIWSELFHGYPKLSPLTTLGNCLQC